MATFNSSIKIKPLQGHSYDSQLFKANLMPTKIVNGNLIYLDEPQLFQGGQNIPFGMAALSREYITKIEKVVEEVSCLDWKLRSGFKQLFLDYPDVAGNLLRTSQNKEKGQSKYLETLILILSQEPGLCMSESPIYRIDGLNGGDRILINELNANTVGGFWLGELAKQCQDQAQSLGILNLQNEITKKILQHTPPGGVYFHPVREVTQSTSYSEKLILNKSLRKHGIHFYMGTLDSLDVTEHGVFISDGDNNFRVDMIGGLSSPEIFENRSDLLRPVASKQVHCPSSISSILSLANKGMLVLLTEMMDGNIDPSLIGLTGSTLNALPFPKTYWLENINGNNKVSYFKNNHVVVKPLDGVGGKGVIFSDSIKGLSQVPMSDFRKYLIQEYCQPFKVEDQDGYQLEGSVDPYFTFSNDGKGKFLGVLIRGAESGSVPNLTTNIKDSDVRHTFSLGVRL